MKSDSDQGPVEVLAEEFLDRQQRGERPTIGEYCERHPGLADEIREVFEAVAMVEELKPDSHDATGSYGSSVKVATKPLQRVGDYRILREAGRGGMGVVYEAEQESLNRRVAVKVLPRSATGDQNAIVRFQREARAAARMHHTNIVPVFDVGVEDNIVYYAMQLIQGQGLDRVIDDLCDLRSDQIEGQRQDGDLANNRPASEAVHNLAASLVTGNFHQQSMGDSDEDHAATDSRGTNGSRDDSPVLSETIELAGGSTVSAALPGQSDISTAESDRIAYFTSVAQIGRQTASALAYAHARGIIHRDIKPSNLLLDTAGVVWVTDFGLAKTNDSEMTNTGDILGTLRYMSPERFKGQCDVRADLYSLGLTLYELLVLKPAFSSSDRVKLIDMMVNSEITKPRSIDPKIPRDLETIVLKACDKDPRRRYQSADDMEDDLQSFIQGEPIRGRRVSLLERAARWSRRNKSLAAALISIAALLVGGVGLLGSFVGTLQDKNEEVTEALNQEKKVRQEGECQRYVSDMNAATLALKRGNFERIRQLLDRYDVESGLESLRRFEWHYLNQQCIDQEGIHNLKFPNAVKSAFYSFDGRHVIVTQLTGQVSVFKTDAFDSAQGIPPEAVASFQAWEGRGWGKKVLRHPTQNAIVFPSGADRRLTLWNFKTNKKIQFSGRHDSTISTFAMSPTGDILASADDDGVVHFWRTKDGKWLDRLPSSARSFSCLEFAASGTLLISGDADGHLDIWDCESMQIIKSQRLSSSRITSLAFSEQSDKLAIGSKFGGLIVMENFSGDQTLRALRGHDRDVRDLEFFADGQTLVSCGYDHVVRFWDTSTFMPLDVLKGHQGHVFTVNLSADQSYLLTSSKDYSVRRWDLDRWIAKDTLFLGGRKWDNQWVTEVEFDPTDDQSIVAIKGDSDSSGSLVGPRNSNASLLRYDVASRATSGLSTDKVYHWCMDVSPKGILATVSSTAELRVLDLRDQAFVQTKVLVTDKANLANRPNVSFSDASDRLVVSDLQDGVRLFEVPGLKRIWTQAAWQTKGDGVVFSPCGKYLANGRTDGVIEIRSAQSGEILHHLTGHKGHLLRPEFSPNGKYLASAGYDHNVLVWSDWKKPEATHKKLVGHTGTVRALEFLPDNATLCSAGSDLTIRFWDLPTSQMRFTIFTETTIECLDVTNNGSTLVAGGRDSTIQIFRASID